MCAKVCRQEQAANTQDGRPPQDHIIMQRLRGSGKHCGFCSGEGRVTEAKLHVRVHGVLPLGPSIRHVDVVSSLLLPTQWAGGRSALPLAPARRRPLIF